MNPAGAMDYVWKGLNVYNFEDQKITIYLIGAKRKKLLIHRSIYVHREKYNLRLNFTTGRVKKISSIYCTPTAK
jgi:hypothetical protein